MHILLLTNIYFDPQNPKAAGEKFRNHLNFFSSEGHKVGLIAARQVSGNRALKRFFCGNYIQKEIDFGCIVYKDFLWHSLDRLHIPNHVRAFFVLRVIKQYIRENGRPDIIHAHGSMYSGVIAAFIWRFFKIPYVLTEHMTHYSQGNIPQKDIHSLRMAFGFSKKILPISQATGKDIEKYFDKKTLGQWVNIPNMVDLDVFSPDISNYHRKENNPYTFLSISRLVPIKSFDLLIRAFVEEFNGLDNVFLKICGTGFLEKELKELVRNLGACDRIVFLGYVNNSDIPGLMQSTDAYVMPSNFESFGIPLIEAIACGVPVIATDCCGPESIVTPDVGLLIEKNNLNQMKQALRFMFEHSKSSYSSTTLSDYAKKTFSTQAVGRKLLSIYLQAINKPNYKHGQ